jgi:hypothetical protein
MTFPYLSPERCRAPANGSARDHRRLFARWERNPEAWRVHVVSGARMTDVHITKINAAVAPHSSHEAASSTTLNKPGFLR